MKLVVPDSAGTPASVAVTVTPSAAAMSPAPGVPEKMRVPAAKPSQSGRALPSVSAAPYVRAWFSASVAAGAV